MRLRVAGGGFGEKDFELTANSNDEISVLKAQLSELMKKDANAEFSGEQMRFFYKGRDAAQQRASCSSQAARAWSCIETKMGRRAAGGWSPPPPRPFPRASA